MLNKTIRFFLEKKLVAVLLLTMLVGVGLSTAPFDWNLNLIPRDPVPVDAIPDLGENQQIVFTDWPGRSPQDVEDQITYPLTAQLLTVPGVKTVRSSSMIGISSIYVIFEEGIDFYWSRARILEKLNALPSGTLPSGSKPSLGPDATGLGQIFWYTLEGRDVEGNPSSGWDPQELRSLQDYYVRYGLSSAEGVAEVSSIGGFVQEYQVDLNPNTMKVYGVTLSQVFDAVRKSNSEIGARTVELNNAEYLVRGLGYIKELKDLEQAVVKVSGNTPIRIQDIGFVTRGPGIRRGLLDKGGAEAVGGVIVARQGANPMQVINNVKAKVDELSIGLPSKTLEDGTVSKVTIVPFYDRSELIQETLGTLEEALTLQILITIIVIVVMVLNLRTSLLISAMLPVAVLMAFIAMQYLNVDANIVALSGIAIAIGTIVDMGVILSENMLRHMEEMDDDESLLEVIYNATTEVASAILTAVTTTIVSFLPVFTMVASEGKLFKPLAFTKTFALIASIIIAITLIPPFAHWLFSIKIDNRKIKLIWNGLLILIGTISLIIVPPWLGVTLICFGMINGGGVLFSNVDQQRINLLNNGFTVAVIVFLLTHYWFPFGPNVSFIGNLIFVIGIVTIVLTFFWLIIRYYAPLIRWCLKHKKLFLALPTSLIIFGIVAWLGFNTSFNFLAIGLNKIGVQIEKTSFWVAATHTFPGFGKEFMPPLDEGAFLLMPTTLPHAGIEEAKDIVQKLDKRLSSIPEVKIAVGKSGRVNSALDPAPISMFEILIQYKSEYLTDKNGRRIRFKVDQNGDYITNNNGDLLQDSNGKYYRQWRNHIQSTDDIWEEILSATRIPGTTSAPKLQPIQTRQIMLQSGMRAPMGIKVKGLDLETIDRFTLQLEQHLREAPGIETQSVFAERIVGKPYLEINWDREQLARYGLNIQDVQEFIAVGVGGLSLTTTVEGRERYPVRVRFGREFRDDPQKIEEILVPTFTGAEVPLGQLASIEYRQGAQSIKSEDTFLVSYVIFDKVDEMTEIEVIDGVRQYLEAKVKSADLIIPASISYEFTGTYENQVRAEKRLSIILPISLILIFLILYFQFKSSATTGMIFTSIIVAWAGGFIFMWLFGQPWFMDFSIFGQNMRDLFQMGPVNLSVAVWVGFLALFGIASDGGVIMASHLDQLFDKRLPNSVEEVHNVVVEASSRRIRPTLMTTATTILALIPVLTSTGRGADIMVPMAIPSVGGMLFQVITLFVIPVLYAAWKEFQLKRRRSS